MTQYHRCWWFMKQNHISNQNKNRKIILKWMILLVTMIIKEPEQHSD